MHFMKDRSSFFTFISRKFYIIRIFPRTARTVGTEKNYDNSQSSDNYHLRLRVTPFAPSLRKTSYTLYTILYTTEKLPVQSKKQKINSKKEQ